MSSAIDSRPDGGELLARTLKQAGVDEVFALHGGHLESFWQSCGRHGLRLIGSLGSGDSFPAVLDFLRERGETLRAMPEYRPRC